MDEKKEQDRVRTPERNQKKYRVCKAKITAEEMQQYMSLSGGEHGCLPEVANSQLFLHISYTSKEKNRPNQPFPTDT